MTLTAEEKLAMAEQELVEMSRTGEGEGGGFEEDEGTTSTYAKFKT